MKKKILIVLVVILAIILILGVLYLIDINRMKNNKPVFFSTWGYDYAPPVNVNNTQIEDNIVLNDENKMKFISYDIYGRNFTEGLEELEKLNYPSSISLSRAIAGYVREDSNQKKYNKLHDICLYFKGGDKDFHISMAIGEEPYTDYKNMDNEADYKKSLINGNEVSILFSKAKNTANNKVFYVCIFKYDDVNFVVETTNLSQDEVITLIKSIFECDMKKLITEKAEEKQFIGTVLEETTTYMIVEPNEDEEERKSSDKICINYGTDHRDYLYGVGRKVLITYKGIVKETYPAQIDSNNISTDGYPDFILLVEKASNKKLNKILNNKDLYKYNSEYDLYYYGLKSVNVRVDGEELTLEEALKSGKVTLDAIIARANKDLDNKYITGDMIKDGGSMIYKYSEYTIIKSHTIEGDRDVYIGTPDMTTKVRTMI